MVMAVLSARFGYRKGTNLPCRFIQQFIQTFPVLAAAFFRLACLMTLSCSYLARSVLIA
ncbi:hypothetical protein J3D56_004376 [Erwinia persicina]|uniref:hypothetical protein n=1 Tax=Erwinia persicina TaxID=55211 RepID=UPI0020A0A2FD|nr:hypothetical protein [Erwinia persicina]MCP1440827.1 hypothetical protein [Erwinia persicina]